jgi:hypothetical protein
VSLAIYVQISDLPGYSRVTYTWLVTRQNRRVAHHGKHILLTGGDAGRFFGHWEHKFSQPGMYQFTGAANVNGERKQRRLTFTVSR